jgi:hypothetical protein
MVLRHFEYVKLTLFLMCFIGTCSRAMSEPSPQDTLTVRYHRESREIVTKLLAEDLVPEDKREEVEELLNKGEPLVALRVAQSHYRRQ